MSELPAPTKIHVEVEDDWQLFVVRGRLSGGFEYVLPIKARPHRNGDVRYFYVHWSGSYPNAQWEELTAIFDAHDSCPHEHGWWFTEQNFRKFASDVRGLNPDYYRRWPGFAPPKIDPESASPDDIELEPEPGLSPQETAFLKRIAYMLSEVSWETLKIWWLTIRKEAIRQIAIERKSLDLGFIRIIPLPYRANWKEALCVRFSSLLSMFRKTPSERHEAMQAAGVYEALASVKLLAIDKRCHFAHWTLETIPSPEIERVMNEQEYARMQKVGPASYASSVLSAMCKRLNSTLEILKYYAGRVSIPAGQKSEAKTFGSVKLVPAVEPGHVRPGKGICEAIQLSPADAFTQFSDEAPAPPTKEPEMKVELPNFLRTVPAFREMIGNGEIEDTPRRANGNLKADRGTVIEVASENLLTPKAPQ